MEPPSPILKEQKNQAENIDDPLSNCIFLIFDNQSLNDEERYLVCTYSVRTGLSYIGISGDIES